MTGNELKLALIDKTPIILKSRQHGTGRYKRIVQIIHQLDKNDKLTTSAVLEDNNRNTTVQVRANEIFLEGEAIDEQ